MFNVKPKELIYWRTFHFTVKRCCELAVCVGAAEREWVWCSWAARARSPSSSSFSIFTHKKTATKESVRLPSLPRYARNMLFLNKLLWNCLVAALIITKYVKSHGPPFFSLLRPTSSHSPYKHTLVCLQLIALWSARDQKKLWNENEEVFHVIARDAAALARPSSFPNRSSSRGCALCYELFCAFSARALWSYRLVYARFVRPLVDHVFMFIHYFIDTFLFARAALFFFSSTQALTNNNNKRRWFITHRT